MTVVILSIIATFLFYWFLRQITAIPVAAIATYFLSISIFDISASRLANVESFVKLWPILGLALLALAMRKQRWQIYGLSGVATALGMLTYDTVMPLFGVALIITMIELYRHKENLRSRMLSLAALITPMLLALPVLAPYLVSRLSYYKFEDKGWSDEAMETLTQYFGNVIHTWFVSLKTDFLYNRLGPLLNTLLLPFLVLGIVVALSLIKKRVSYWILLWGGLFIFPIPVLANSPMGRVYYPALPAVYALIALGIFYFWKEIDRFMGQNLRPILYAVTLVPLIWLPFFNLYIYFNEVFDANDRLIRREIGELAAQVASKDSIILLPVIPGANAPLNNEHQMLELYMMQNIPSSEIEKAYQYVTADGLLYSIKYFAPTYQKIEIIFDISETGGLSEALQQCYPQGAYTEGNPFSRFSLSDATLGSMSCSTASLEIESEGNNSFDWELLDATTEKLEAHCKVRQTEVEWLEGESLLMSPGWQIEKSFVPDWNGDGFVMDNYGSEPLVFEVDIEPSHRSYIWVRYYKRVGDNIASYLNINNSSHPFAEIKSDNFNVWKWEKIGPITLNYFDKVSISHPYNGNPKNFMAIFIDSIIITTDEYFSPDFDPWEPINPKVFLFNQPQSNGTVYLDLPSGSHRCKAIVESDLPVVRMDGSISSSLVSNSIDIEGE